MALREVSPLGTDEWNQLVAELEKEPTDEQIKFLQNSVENGRKLKVHR